MIKFEKTTFQYENVTIFENINTIFEKNNFYIILGPNGGGKTTFLKLIMGILSPKKGLVSIDNLPPQKKRSTIGYLPQHLIFDSLFPISVHEFTLSGSISKLPWYGIWPKKIKHRADEMLEYVEMTKHKNQSMGKLSGGQRQLSFLAHALMDDPDILLLDEPTNGLDPMATKKMYDIIKQMKGKKTIILVTHITSNLFDYADEVFYIQNKITKLDPKSVCKHFEMGLHHTPTT